MSNEDFELLLAMAEEAENAESTIDTPCENIHTEDPPAETAKAPEAPTSLMAGGPLGMICFADVSFIDPHVSS